MKKKMIVMVAALLLLVAIVLPVAEAQAAMMDVNGECTFNHSGRNVTYGGLTESGKTEDTIRVTVILWEKRSGTWYEVDRKTKTKTNSDIVETEKDFTVTGGYYYKVTATHYTCTNGVSASGSSSIGSFWIS